MENQQEKLRHLSELKESLMHEYPVNIKINAINKALEVQKNKFKKKNKKTNN